MDVCGCVNAWVDVCICVCVVEQSCVYVRDRG